MNWLNLVAAMQGTDTTRDFSSPSACGLAELCWALSRFWQEILTWFLEFAYCQAGWYPCFGELQQRQHTGCGVIVFWGRTEVASFASGCGRHREAHTRAVSPPLWATVTSTSCRAKEIASEVLISFTVPDSSESFYSIFTLVPDDTTTQKEYQLIAMKRIIRFGSERSKNKR